MSKIWKKRPPVNLKEYCISCLSYCPLNVTWNVGGKKHIEFKIFYTLTLICKTKNNQQKFDETK